MMVAGGGVKGPNEADEAHLLAAAAAAALPLPMKQPSAVSEVASEVSPSSHRCFCFLLPSCFPSWRQQQRRQERWSWRRCRVDGRSWGDARPQSRTSDRRLPLKPPRLPLTTTLSLLLLSLLLSLPLWLSPGWDWGGRDERSGGGGLKLELYLETCRRWMLLMMGGVVIDLRVGLGWVGAATGAAVLDHCMVFRYM